MFTILTHINKINKKRKMYSNVQSCTVIKNVREGENYFRFIKLLENILRLLVLNYLDNMSGLHHDLERF